MLFYPKLINNKRVGTHILENGLSYYFVRKGNQIGLLQLCIYAGRFGDAGKRQIEIGGAIS